MKKENLLLGVLSVAVVASTAFSFFSIKKLEKENNNLKETLKNEYTQTTDTSNNESLRYQKIAGKEEYRVIGVGTVLSLDIKIPSKYKGLPVTEIAPYAFYGCKLKSVVISLRAELLFTKIDTLFCLCFFLSYVVAMSITS